MKRFIKDEADQGGNFSHGLMPHTRRAYASQWKLWLDHCAATGVSPFPATAEAVANWIALRANEGDRGGKRMKLDGKGHALSTLRNAVAAIKSVHAEKGQHFDTTAPAIVAILRDARRAEPQIMKSTLTAPMRASLILDVLRGMGGTPLELRDACLLALGYSFALRRSDLVALDLDCSEEGGGLFLTIDPQRMVVRYTTKKEALLMSRAQNEPLLDAVEQWLAFAQVRPGQAILRNVSRWGTVGRERLNDESVSKIIKKRIAEYFARQGDTAAEARLKADRFSGHSLRVGAAVTGFENGDKIGAVVGAVQIGYERAKQIARDYNLTSDSVYELSNDLKN